MQGAAHRFDDNLDNANLVATKVNSLDSGGNVYQSPNLGLNIRVTELFYWDKAATNEVLTQFAAVIADQAVVASTTNFVFILANALVINQSGFPLSGSFIPLATVITDTSEITSINTRRPHITQF